MQKDKNPFFPIIRSKSWIYKGKKGEKNRRIAILK